MHDENPASSPRSSSPVGCPECSDPLAGTHERCPRCALPLRGPVAAELWRLDGALAGLRAREAELLIRRGHLLGLLRQERAGQEPAERERAERERAGQEGTGQEPAGREQAGKEPAGQERAGQERAHLTGGRPAGPPETVPEPAGRPKAVPEPGKDFSPRAVQNLLLGLGGLLLAVAAVVFTVVSWGSMGLGGRAAILVAVTGLTFAAPALLVRRGLVTTAETIAMLGAALLFLDGYAARRTGLAGADGMAVLHYAALLFALVALAMVGYSRLLPLRLPLPLAIVLAQFPLPLLALGETTPWITAALAATAAADAVFLVFPVFPAFLAFHVAGRTSAPGGRGPLRTVAVCFGVVWGLGVCHGLLESFPKKTPGTFPGSGPAAGSLGDALLLVTLAVIGLAVARRTRNTDRLWVVTGVSALTLTAGLAAPAWPLPLTWWAVPYTVAALVTVAVMLYAPGLDEPRIRSSGAVSAGVLAVLTALPFANDVIFTLVAPFNRLGDVWSGSPGFADARLIAPFPQFPVVSGLLAVASALAAARGRASMGFAALAAGTLAVAVAPVAFGWGHGVDLVVLSALAVVLVTGMTLAGRPRWAGALSIAAGAVSAVATATALAERSSTYATLGVLLVAWGAAAFVARVREAAAVSLVAGVLSATGLMWAVSTGTRWLPAGDGLSLSLAAGAVLAALVALRGGSPARPSPEGAPGETEGAPGENGDLRRSAGLVLSVVLAVLAVVSAHAAVTAILGFHRPLVRPWTAATGPAGGHPPLAVVVGLVAAAAVLVSWQVARRRGATRAALLAWPAVVVALPVSVALPYGVELGLFVAGTVPTAWMAARSRANAVFGGVAALWTAFVAISWALMSEPATLLVLPAVAMIAVAVVLGDQARARARGRGRAGAGAAVAFGERAVAPVAAGLAALLAGGEALAAGLALDWPVRHAAFGPLVVACAAAAVAGRFRRATFAVCVEAAGYVLAGAGLPLASADLPPASLACAVTGVLMAGTALRPDRRWAGYVGTGFLLLASWLRLLASDISVIEAYTVPFSLVLLAFGWWRARGGETSSWVAYGPGLVSSLVPSMFALLTGSGWLRPLLLGVVSLAVLLAGARFRLQAPAVLGGLTLAVVALHELAPWIAEVVVLVPRWVPMALGGVLLVVVGATYEARLRDVRRLRGAVGRMR
ncbi:SCO7613 C-terminal domain-containing membrane protein [Streptosporangium sp. H16]|uniref:SCO7613 C-terminal domain-containing membrane protein n=1 Tax=Streptosporangium sp. H16 TaxID=3444184 RepID=UPI003F7A053E